MRQWPGRLKLRSCYFTLTIVAAGLTANGNVPRFQVRKTILGSKRGNSYIIFASKSRLLLVRMVLGPQQQQHSVISSNHSFKDIPLLSRMLRMTTSPESPRTCALGLGPPARTLLPALQELYQTITMLNVIQSDESGSSKQVTDAFLHLVYSAEGDVEGEQVFYVLS